MSQSCCKLVRKCLKKLILTIIGIIGSIIILSASPFLLLLLSPLYLWRWFIGKLAKICRPDLAKMMTSRSSIIGIDPMYSKPLSTLVVKVIVGGSVSYEVIRHLTEKNLVEARNENGELKHPELQQSIVQWMGYLFFKWDKHFKIENHVKTIEDEPNIKVTCEKELDKLVKEFKEKPFAPNRSPWEWLVITNFHSDVTYPSATKAGGKKEEKVRTILLTRFHHSLVDGYSTTKVLLKAVGELEKVNLLRKEFTKKSCLMEVVDFVGLLLKAPYELVQLSMEPNDVNPWHPQEHELHRSSHLGWMDPIPLAKFRPTKQKYNVTVTGIVLTAITSAIRSSMLRAGINPPKEIHCGLPLPWPSHPDKLRNHMCMSVTRLPIGTACRMKRFKICKRASENLKSSTIPIVSFRLIPLLGSLPAWLIRKLCKNANTTVLLSNFPSPFGKIVDITHSYMAHLVFCGGFGPGRLGIGFTALSYMDDVTFGVQADEYLFPTEHSFQSLFDDFKNELLALIEGNIEMATSDTPLLQDIAVNM